MPHNHHFLWFGKSVTGQSRQCLAAAQYVRNYVDKQQMREPGFGTLQHFCTLPMWTYIRFCMWDEALAEDKPADDLKYPLGVWYYAGGMALANQGQPEEAMAKLGALSRIAADPALDDVTIWEINTTRDLLRIAEKVLAARIAEARGNLADAERMLSEAVEREGQLNYDEPPSWSIPVRQRLGAVLLSAGKLVEAEAVYRAQLEKYPHNGWSLLGLHQALKAQQESQAAAKAKRRFDKAWKNADVRLSSSCNVRSQISFK